VTEGDHGRRADQYDDPTHDYRQYWQGRDYEHAAEEIAVRRLLGHRHFRRAIDVGGGFGRLSKLLTEFADSVLLAEPSQQQLDKAVEFLVDDPRIERRQLQAADLQQPDGSADLVLFVRVLHHIPDPGRELREIARVLEPGGRLVFSMTHPQNSAKPLGDHPDRGSYFARYGYDERRERDGATMTFHDLHRPLEDYAAALRDAGLLIEDLREPRPPADYLAEHPEMEKWLRRPCFLHVRAVRPRG
jgi:SAM-dependent methyltransferase